MIKQVLLADCSYLVLSFFVLRKKLCEQKFEAEYFPR